ESAARAREAREFAIMLFKDRKDAGRVLVGKLKAYANRADVLVLALPRGGVPVAFVVAQALGAPLDIFLVRKLGTPGHEELAMGAIASGNIRVMNEKIVQMIHPSKEAVERVTMKERQELERREREYRGGRGSLKLEGKT